MSEVRYIPGNWEGKIKQEEASIVLWFRNPGIDPNKVLDEILAESHRVLHRYGIHINYKATIPVEKGMVCIIPAECGKEKK